MTERQEHFDEDSNLRVSDKLSEDLNALFKPASFVPPEIDRAIMDKARQHLVRRSRQRSPLRWAGPAASAAAAAVIIFAVVSNTGRQPGSAVFKTAKRPDSSVLISDQAPAQVEMYNSYSVGTFKSLKTVRAHISVDIDGNGRVDILDAFKLARDIESAEKAEMKWDINGDGFVNRSDVDFVAFAAVRLDKGV